MIPGSNSLNLLLMVGSSEDRTHKSSILNITYHLGKKCGSLCNFVLRPTIVLYAKSYPASEAFLNLNKC